MYALISIYDDENRCIGKDKILTPCMVQHNATSTTYKFSAEAIVAEDMQPVMKGKFQHDPIPEPETNKCMICGRVIYDDKVICDRCFEIAKREGFLE